MMADIEDAASTSDATESSFTANSSSDSQMISILDRFRSQTASDLSGKEK